MKLECVTDVQKSSSRYNQSPSGWYCATMLPFAELELNPPQQDISKTLLILFFWEDIVNQELIT